MKYLKNFDSYERIDENLKSWVKTFLLMASLGLVPNHVVAGDKNDKKEFVEKQPQDKIDAALFVKFMNDNHLVDIDSSFNQFKATNVINTSLTDIKKYINRSGKVVLFDSKYVAHDYSNADIHKFTPDNWLTDIGGFIPDEDEPIINNWISDYEKKTSIEIGVITVKSLGDQDIVDYAQEQFKRLGIGKKYSDDGILLVFSMDDRKSRIHVGYGVEGDLTDGMCGQILRDQITPNFKEGNYEAGILAALNEIKNQIGEEAYEIKKKNDKEKVIQGLRELEEGANTFSQWLLSAALIAVIGLYITYVIRKRRLKKEEREKLISDVNENIKLIETLKSALPKSSGVSGSNRLLLTYEKLKSEIESIGKQDAEYTNDNREKLVSLYNTLYNTYKTYTDTKKDILTNMQYISNISSVRQEAYDVVDNAVKAAREINQLGYKTGEVPSRSDVDSLNSMFLSITALLSTDIDASIRSFKTYAQNLSSIKSKNDHIQKTLSSIRKSIDRVQGWEKEINRTLGSFKQVADSSEQSKLKTLINNFTTQLSTSKDYVALDSELDKPIKYMLDVIRKYEEEKREEERRRRRKEEEEEEERRRRDSYNSSSSTSSSNSFSGFGGGNSGGAGASGSW